VGTFGLFGTMFLLFLRFLPMIAIAEIKAVMPQADPHNYDSNRKYIPPKEKIPSYVKIINPADKKTLDQDNEKLMKKDDLKNKSLEPVFFVKPKNA